MLLRFPRARNIFPIPGWNDHVTKGKNEVNDQRRPFSTRECLHLELYGSLDASLFHFQTYWKKSSCFNRSSTKVCGHLTASAFQKIAQVLVVFRHNVKSPSGLSWLRPSETKFGAIKPPFDLLGGLKNKTETYPEISNIFSIAPPWNQRCFLNVRKSYMDETTAHEGDVLRGGKLNMPGRRPWPKNLGGTPGKSQREELQQQSHWTITLKNFLRRNSL